MDYIAHVFSFEWDYLTCYETLVATHNGFYLDIVVDGGAGDGADRRIHGRRIAARSQYSDTLNIVHISSYI